MRSPWKQALLCTVLGVMMVAPAFAEKEPASSPADPRLDGLFGRLTNGACKNPDPLPDNQCNHINGLACDSEGTRISCTRSNGQISTCLCQESCHWACIF